jgi:methyl-accepting chemotaxis protein
MPSATWMLLQQMEKINARRKEEASQGILAVRNKLQSGAEGSQNLVARIGQIMSSMQMLALNASIEAAKVGVHGRGFAVVADHMTRSVDAVRHLTQEIVSVNQGIQDITGQIDAELERLR